LRKTGNKTGINDRAFQARLANNEPDGYENRKILIARLVKKSGLFMPNYLDQTLAEMTRQQVYQCSF
jgi:hypothetical protein